ncbi:hypothetical protein Plec18167_006379 [Paecilomyces lecythidis]|uniref:DUF1593 domain-containing protein n=1 Tax=Paecilomyces lecythidis TaxID=3004212 RepID=A0ABR3XCB9_9EURO
MQLITRCLLVVILLVAAAPATGAYASNRSEMLRTVVTTDMEQDDLASLIRYLLYSSELDTQGIIYTSSRYHWSGDGKGTKFFLPGREYTTPQWTFRWTGTHTIQDKVLKAYSDIYPNLINHDPFYPTPEELQSKVSIGNIDFEGEMDHDTDGSNLIRSLLLDTDPRPLYLQAWGGTSTIARALRSVEVQYSGSVQWGQIKKTISSKAVILASGFQDETYANYISRNWSQIKTVNLEAGYDTWGYNCPGQGIARGSPDDEAYFQGVWIKANIETGAYGRLYRSWGDGQSMPGDREDVFGNLTKGKLSFQPSCNLARPYDFLSEGDNVAFNPLLTTGIQDPANLNLGGWGGRSKRTNSSANLWEMVSSEKAPNGTEVTSYTTNRWISAVQNDFAARMQWTLTPDYQSANHPPSVKILNGTTIKAGPGQSIRLAGTVQDPDGDNVTTSWWQFFEEGTYYGNVTVASNGKNQANVTIPVDARSGESISIIFQGTDNGTFPLTRYSRVFIIVS